MAADAFLTGRETTFILQQRGFIVIHHQSKNALQGMKIETKHALLHFLKLVGAYKFSRDCEIPALVQSFPAVVSHRSNDKSELLGCIKFRTQTDSHTLSREISLPQRSNKRLLAQTGNTCVELTAYLQEVVPHI